MSWDNQRRANQVGSIARSATLSPMLQTLFLQHCLCRQAAEIAAGDDDGLIGLNRATGR
jgi:hypothetical protein